MIHPPQSPHPATIISRPLAALCMLFLLLGPACSDDGSEPAASEQVAVSSAADLDWSVEEVVYGRGLTHDGDFNASSSEPMDLVGDLYVPEEVDGLRPALLIVHGGGFLFGERTQPELVHFAEYFAARGWVVFSIDYRLARDRGTSPPAWNDMVEDEETRSVRIEMGKAVYPAVRDAKAAVRWLQANADDYAISPDHIAVMGGSAGAHISVALGVTNPADFRDELSADDDPTLASTHLDHSGRVAVVLDFWGGADAADKVHVAFGGSPRWDETDAPTLIVHGTDDSIVPFEEGETLRDKFEESGAPHTFVALEGADHGPWGASVDGQNLRQLADAFLHEHLELAARQD
jgi:para-nitrobenzyl esterase